MKLGPEGLNRQSPSWVVGMATSVEPSGGLLKLDNQKLYVWLVVLSLYKCNIWHSHIDRANPFVPIKC